MFFYAFLVAAVMVAVNVAVYAASGSPYALGAIVACGLIALADLVQIARDR